MTQFALCVCVCGKTDRQADRQGLKCWDYRYYEWAFLIFLVKTGLSLKARLV